MSSLSPISIDRFLKRRHHLFDARHRVPLRVGQPHRELVVAHARRCDAEHQSQIIGGLDLDVCLDCRVGNDVTPRRQSGQRASGFQEQQTHERLGNDAGAELFGAALGFAFSRQKVWRNVALMERTKPDQDDAKADLRQQDAPISSDQQRSQAAHEVDAPA